ncbi:hypothetical protein METBIDRAFT_41865 [Metschnikowia bicuspidata var. bicuspidata NRRL YB-4993]|uniref:Gfd2/YDR514C-like C-terminal domain-containing protein n=1 Tax=Metschnikowia bicuspidata var. bicuspidata NRRL YB-4993 TaxID=869754 RepID=A0A1A0HA61_9ASCO|nr:hypothetical protein METBIDRAFT_41865 [Metschnikowia bicuspidata var. bicuspidata NRRL YB-4993]OBA20890.1 hypothetical protein METBIDRAFT_41865 [Metschnikowia bicuspidata var. bicuspidata NRRL YB-4993]
MNDLRSRGDRRLNTKSKLSQIQKQMDRVFTRSSALFCVDVEAWEHDTKQITEIGISIYDPSFQELALVPNIKTYHIRIAEGINFKNGDYVPDHSANFSGGDSYVFSRLQARSLLQALINFYFGPNYPFFCSLVGHDLKGDIKWLENLGVSISRNVRKLDTQTLFSYTHGRDRASLKNALRTLNQPYAFLHNAGNDAYYTILLALKLCDPGVRRLTGIEYFQPGEYPGEPVKYRKYPTNESKLTAMPVLKLFDEIIGMEL